MQSWSAASSGGAFQPIRNPQPPQVEKTTWPRGGIDQFVLARLEREGLDPAAPADKRTLLRRLHFVLTGLPPTPGELERFLEDEAPGAYERVVDGLLASPHFGERWARHWMDWMRFAESHGSEGDPRIPYMWRYRDYLIRALNADVPYNQLVREHLAGDLLVDPRIDEEHGINESALGIAHFRLVQHGFGPVDALQELVRFTDDQIDVLSKAFLGLTVSCARCHDHKFDPISQEDFYALYGIMTSCRPATVIADTPARQEINRDEMAELKSRIKGALADAWMGELDGLSDRLKTMVEAQRSKDPTGKGISKAPGPKQSRTAQSNPLEEARASRGSSPLHAFALLKDLEGDALTREWNTLQNEWRQSSEEEVRESGEKNVGWDLRHEDYGEWFTHGNGMPLEPSPPGAFHILPEGETIISNILPAGVYTHLLSDKHSGVLTSPSFKVKGEHLSLRILGGRNARARLVLQNYPRVASGIYGRLSKVLSSDSPEWVHWNTNYWVGETAHIELATADDLPVEVKNGNGRSWFGIVEVEFPGSETYRPEERGAPLFSLIPSGRKPVSKFSDLVGLYEDALKGCLGAWRSGSMTDLQAEFLGYFIRTGLLPNSLAEIPAVAPLVATYRNLESEVPIPTRIPGVLEAVALDQPLFERGDHKKPAAKVPRRFLEVVDASPYDTKLSGRLEFAEDLFRADNPLTSRIIVNRLWYHVFGRGLCATVDNFGRMGEQPSHPELLDYLARELCGGGLVHQGIDSRIGLE